MMNRAARAAIDAALEKIAIVRDEAFDTVSQRWHALDEAIEMIDEAVPKLLSPHEPWQDEDKPGKLSLMTWTCDLCGERVTLTDPALREHLRRHASEQDQQ